MIILTDDGTLDTVLECVKCGEQMRYNYAMVDEGLEHQGDGRHYERWVWQIIEDEIQEHECYWAWLSTRTRDPHDL
jgi:hypothetical protein